MTVATPDLERDGYAVCRGVLDEDQLAAARDAADGLFAAPVAAVSEYCVIVHDAWRRAPVLGALLAPAAAAAKRLLGCDRLVVFQDLLIDKRGAEATPVPYHQDLAYLPLDRDDGLVVWVALDDVSPERGCMHYVPGSHRLGPRRPADFTGTIPMPSWASLPPIDVAGHAITAAPCRAGDLLAHRFLTWHGSPPNTTPAPRRAWSIWFVTPDTCWAPDRAPHPFLHELAPKPGDEIAGERFPRY